MAKTKNKIEVKLIRGNNINSQMQLDMVEYKRMVKEGEKTEKAIRPALLISRLDHPEVVKYGDTHIRISPRVNERIGDVEKLPEKLPVGIFVKKIALVKVKKEV